MELRFNSVEGMSGIGSRDVMHFVETVTCSPKFKDLGVAFIKDWVMEEMALPKSKKNHKVMLFIRIKFTVYGNPDQDHGIDYTYSCYRATDWSEVSITFIKTRP